MINKKIILNFVFFLAIALLFSNCSDSASKSEKKEVQKIEKENVLNAIINVKGMTCEGCEASIQNAVSKLPGVVSVKASHVDESTIVKYDKTQTSVEEIENLISSTGYKIFQSEEKVEKKEVPKTAKCGEGKCGAGKCGHAE